MEGSIVQINMGPGGLPKHPVPAGLITPLGLEGDAHRNTRLHGGPMIYDGRAAERDPSSPRWGMSGLYAAVRSPGRVKTGDIIAVVATLA